MSSLAVSNIKCPSPLINVCVEPSTNSTRVKILRTGCCRMKVLFCMLQAWFTYWSSYLTWAALWRTEERLAPVQLCRDPVTFVIMVLGGDFLRFLWFNFLLFWFFQNCPKFFRQRLSFFIPHSLPQLMLSNYDSIYGYTRSIPNTSGSYHSHW